MSRRARRAARRRRRWAREGEGRAGAPAARRREEPRKQPDTQADPESAGGGTSPDSSGGAARERRRVLRPCRPPQSASGAAVRGSGGRARGAKIRPPCRRCAALARTRAAGTRRGRGCGCARPARRLSARSPEPAPGRRRAAGRARAGSARGSCTRLTGAAPQRACAPSPAGPAGLGGTRGRPAATAAATGAASPRGEQRRADPAPCSPQLRAASVGAGFGDLPCKGCASTRSLSRGARREEFVRTAAAPRPAAPRAWRAGCVPAAPRRAACLRVAEPAPPAARESRARRAAGWKGCGRSEVGGRRDPAAGQGAPVPEPAPAEPAALRRLVEPRVPGGPRRAHRDGGLDTTCDFCIWCEVLGNEGGGGVTDESNTALKYLIYHFGSGMTSE
ncbi:serine/arginine repetitive matrix protein 3-like [Equus caballus]|uniref:serine/arginine repetitive matrix protein 3-like n=1 Tax=Equus caballus TaxID=9796 RepID=UPI0038B3B318